jgi:hypothetical protein
VRALKHIGDLIKDYQVDLPFKNEEKEVDIPISNTQKCPVGNKTKNESLLKITAFMFTENNQANNLYRLTDKGDWRRKKRANVSRSKLSCKGAWIPHNRITQSLCPPNVNSRNNGL